MTDSDAKQGTRSSISASMDDNRTVSFFSAIGQRSTGPGGLYNVGNVIALIGGVMVQAMRSRGGDGFSSIFYQYLFGNLGASCLTLAMVIFLVAGEAYHRAWRDPSAPLPRLNQLGDFLSGIGAMVLTVALVYFGDIWLAITAGFLLSLGKFGTALLPEKSDHGPGAKRLTATFRLMVVISRFPSLAALVVSLSTYFMNGGIGLDALTSAIMLMCYLIWLRADYFLWTYSRITTEKSPDPCPLDFMP